jgi:hypothetical protein
MIAFLAGDGRARRLVCHDLDRQLARLVGDPVGDDRIMRVDDAGWSLATTRS